MSLWSVTQSAVNGLWKTIHDKTVSGQHWWWDWVMSSSAVWNIRQFCRCLLRLENVPPAGMQIIDGMCTISNLLEMLERASFNHRVMFRSVHLFISTISTINYSFWARTNISSSKCDLMRLLTKWQLDETIKKWWFQPRHKPHVTHLFLRLNSIRAFWTNIHLIRNLSVTLSSTGWMASSDWYFNQRALSFCPQISEQVLEWSFQKHQYSRGVINELPFIGEFLNLPSHRRPMFSAQTDRRNASRNSLTVPMAFQPSM